MEVLYLSTCLGSESISSGYMLVYSISGCIVDVRHNYSSTLLSSSLEYSGCSDAVIH